MEAAWSSAIGRGSGFASPGGASPRRARRSSPLDSCVPVRVCVWDSFPVAPRAGEKHQSASPFAHPLVWCCWFGVA